METQRPQLNLAELHQLRWFLGGLIGLLSAWTVFYMEVDALLALVAITLTVPVFTLYPRFSRALPPVFHLLAFPVIVVLFAVDLWSTREPLPAMIRLDLMLLCYRCVAPRGRREDLQLILLALFVVVVTGVYTVSIAFVAQILLFTASSLGLLFAVTLADARMGGAKGAEASAGVAADAGWERVRWPELFARLRAVADLRVVGLGAALFAGVVGLSAVLFLALPRFEISNEFFLDRLITKKSRTGFSENITFQDVVDIQQDSSVALMVDISDRAAVPTELYWRMLVLDEYSGQGFRLSANLRNTFVSSSAKMHAHIGRERSQDDRTVWTMYFQPGVSKYLPLMGAFSRITFGEPHVLVQSDSLRIASLPLEPAKMVAYRVDGMDTDGILRDRAFARYGHIVSTEDRLPRRQGEDRALEFGAKANGAPREVTFLDLGLVRAEDQDQLRAWALEIGGAGEGGADFARRAGAWLQSRHTYSLSMRLGPGEGDPLVRWMASSEPGHCELFAGGIVMLARAAGIPARLVTGFKGGTWNATSGSITVRNSDAHAWAEVWDTKLGAWLRTDATPGAQITPSASASPMGGSNSLEQDSGWEARIDGLRIFWYRRIVSFDQDTQVELLRATKDYFRAAQQSARGKIETSLRAFVRWLREPWGFSRVAGIVLAISVSAGLILLWRKMGRAWWMSWRSRRVASHRRDPVRIEASRWLERLERMERVRPAAPAEAKAALGAARMRLLRLRFGARESWAPPTEVFRQAKEAARMMARARSGVSGA
jgi:hypothetical protein